MMETNRRVVSKSLKLGGAAMLLALAGNAQADVIAVAIDNITNISLSGTGFATEAPVSTSGTTAANYTGFPSTNGSANCVVLGQQLNCNPGGLSANAPQSTSGPGTFPALDFTQPPAGGFVGSRGDANVVSVFTGGQNASAINVAESRLTAGATGGATGTNQFV